MKSTTGAEATALSIAVRTWEERSRVWRREGEMCRDSIEVDVADGDSVERAPRRAWVCLLDVVMDVETVCVTYGRTQYSC
jgi:hypothetical protein